MPKKDGTPTAAERRDAERVAGNERFIAERTTDELREARSYMVDGDEWAERIDAELALRANDHA